MVELSVVRLSVTGMTGVIGGFGSGVDRARPPVAGPEAELLTRLAQLDASVQLDDQAVDMEHLDDHAVLEAMADCERVLAWATSGQLVPRPSSRAGRRGSSARRGPRRDPRGTRRAVDGSGTSPTTRSPRG